MHFIGLDVHKKTISYCVKDAAGRVYQEGRIGSTRRDLDGWIRAMPQPRMIAMEATLFLLPTSSFNDQTFKPDDVLKVKPTLPDTRSTARAAGGLGA